jgi:hypothetical protein
MVGWLSKWRLRSWGVKSEFGCGTFVYDILLLQRLCLFECSASMRALLGVNYWSLCLWVLLTIGKLYIVDSS